MSILYIFGAGGLGREVLSLCKAINRWDKIFFIDDNVKPGTLINGHLAMGGLDFLNSIEETAEVVLAIGDPKLKSRIYNSLRHENRIYPSLVHPSAVIMDPATVRLGRGAMLCAGTVLTTNVKIGDHVLVNLNSTIGHDVNVDDFCSIMPGVNIAGEVNIGEAVLVGSGANIINRIKIGSFAAIGMGSVVIKDVAAENTVIGVPARPLIR